jgi:hypothetical protein
VMLAGLMREPGRFTDIKNDLEDLINTWTRPPEHRT